MALIAPVKLRSVASASESKKYALQPSYCPSLELIDEFKGFHWRDRMARLIPGGISGGKIGLY